MIVIDFGESYKGLLPHDIMEIFLQSDLHWNVKVQIFVANLIISRLKLELYFIS